VLSLKLIRKAAHTHTHTHTHSRTHTHKHKTLTHYSRMHTRAQVGFFDIVALPLFQSFAQAFPEATPMLDSVKDNYHVRCVHVCWFESSISPNAGCTQGSNAGCTQGSNAGCTQGSNAGCTQGSNAGCTQGSNAGCTQGSIPFVWQSNWVHAIIVDEWNGVYCLLVDINALYLTLLFLLSESGRVITAILRTRNCKFTPLHHEGCASPLQDTHTHKHTRTHTQTLSLSYRCGVRRRPCARISALLSLPPAHQYYPSGSAVQATTQNHKNHRWPSPPSGHHHQMAITFKWPSPPNGHHL